MLTMIMIMIGNSTRAIILLTCEVSIALISSCFPSIFSLVNYIVKKHFSHPHNDAGTLDKAVSSKMKIYIDLGSEEVQEHGRVDLDQPEDA